MKRSAEMSDCSIKVVCRFRPVNKREKKEGGGENTYLLFEDDTNIQLKSFNGRQPQMFTFDRVFYEPTTTQASSLTVLLF